MKIAITNKILMAILGLCYSASLQNSLATGTVIRGSSTGVGSLRKLEPDSSCSLDSAVILAEEIELTAEWAEACSGAVESSKDTVQGVIDVIEYIRNFSGEASDLLEILDEVEDFMARFSVFTDKIPKMGKIISKIRETLNKFLAKVQKVVDKFDDKLEIGQMKLENVTHWLEKLENFTGDASDILSDAGSKMNTAISCSNRFDCAADDIIDGVAGIIPIAPLELSQASFATCATVFQPFDSLGLDLELPDIQFVHELNKAVGRIEEWIDDVIGEAAAKADYALCCDNVLRTLGDILEGIVKVADLATCWTDPAIDSVQDLGIAGLFAIFEVIIDDTVNVAFKDTLPILSLIGSIDFTAQSVELPALTVNEDTCELEFSDEDTFEINTKALGLNFTVPESIGDLISLAGDVEDAASLGAQIAESCSEALSAFEEDDDEIDCCDVARTCDAEDRIILYEGPDCSQNVAGTLPLPSVGGSEKIKANDQLCLANDESKSVLISGPMPAGVTIEIGDSPDNFCADDYTAIVLTRELKADESVCVPSFESTKVRTVRSDYTMYHQRLNGLNGKASRYQVTNPSPSAATFTPQCVHPVQFYEGNTCSQDIVTLMNIPSTGSKKKVYKGSEDFPSFAANDFVNDETRSVKLVGPIPAGVRIELFDSRTEDCGDDYSSIVTTKALAEYEEVCIGTFEQDKTDSRYKQTYVPHNGLDGKVSTITFLNSANTNPSLTCRLRGNGESCGDDNDCLNGFCGRGICSSGTSGSACGHDGDCRNSRCVDDICRAGVNGDPCEKDSDCNGLCGRGVCSDGSTGSLCGSDNDCNNGLCVKDVCRAGITGDVCESDGDCNNRRCVKDRCRAGRTNDPCEKDSDCNNERCVKNFCRAGNNGNVCEKDSDCNSRRCDGTCKSKLNKGDSCNEDSDCKSNQCGWWIFPGDCA